MSSKSVSNLIRQLTQIQSYSSTVHPGRFAGNEAIQNAIENIDDLIQLSRGHVRGKQLGCALIRGETFRHKVLTSSTDAVKITEALGDRHIIVMILNSMRDVKQYFETEEPPTIGLR